VAVTGTIASSPIYPPHGGCMVLVVAALVSTRKTARMGRKGDMTIKQQLQFPIKKPLPSKYATSAATVNHGGLHNG